MRISIFGMDWRGVRLSERVNVESYQGICW